METKVPPDGVPEVNLLGDLDGDEECRGDPCRDPELLLLPPRPPKSDRET